MNLQERGVRLGNETLSSVRADQKIRPLGDRIIVEPLEWSPSFLAVVYRGKPLRGIVRAAGKGCYPKRYNGPKGQRSKSWDSRAFRATEVKVGDTVELGGLEIGGYLFPTIRWGDKEMIVAREEDICGVIE
jgi:co-chaperonin GroES (HSP10)